jgi:DNA-binding transcriptional MerR regulator
MAWSTREIAHLAGTSLRAVRHYHEVGLLDEPERLANGYKQYGVAHLVRILRITHLSELGFTLPQISGMGDGRNHPEQALRTLNDEVTAAIERLERVRAELDLIQRRAELSDLPAELAPAAAGAELSDTDRAFVVVLTRVLGPRGLQAYADMLQNLPAYPEASEFDDLPVDAGERTREDVAAHLTAYARLVRAEHPGLEDLYVDAPRSPTFTKETLGRAMQDLYNTAQLDVLRRSDVLLRASPDSWYLLGRNSF